MGVCACVWFCSCTHQAHALESGGESDARRALDRAVAEARDAAAAEAERRAAVKLAEVRARSQHSPSLAFDQTFP